MSHHYGLLMPGSAVSGDAKACNLQAGAEGMLTGLACALAGADSMLAFGLMDGAETARWPRRSWTRCRRPDRAVAARRPHRQRARLTDDILEVGIGGHFLSRAARGSMSSAGELWYPGLWRRGTFEQHAGTSLVEDAWERAQELIRTTTFLRCRTTSRGERRSPH